MTLKDWFHLKSAVCFALLLSGCVTFNRFEVPADFKNGTVVLAELEAVYERDEIVDASRHPKFTKGWYANLLKAGYQDTDILDDSEVLAISYCYAHNSSIPICRHIGAYMAHVSPELRGQLIPRNESIGGDLVEIELRTTPSNTLIGVVTRVFRGRDDWGNCRIKSLNYQGKLLFSFVGPPQGYWISCDGLEEAGWVKNVFGPGVYEWQKLSSVPSTNPK